MTESMQSWAILCPGTVLVINSLLCGVSLQHTDHGTMDSKMLEKYIFFH